MQVWGITPEQADLVIKRVSFVAYGNNVTANGGISRAGKTERAPITFTLRVESSRGPGAHRSSSGRRTVSACWHAHRDVMRALLEAGATRIKTWMADYRSVEDFEQHHRVTAHQNVGSMMQPASYVDLCECAE